MKKIFSLLLFLFSLSAFGQLKIKDLPTTTSGTLNDYLLKDFFTGASGATQKITIANFITTYGLNTYTATPIFQGANSYTANTSINNTGTFSLTSSGLTT